MLKAKILIAIVVGACLICGMSYTTVFAAVNNYAKGYSFKLNGDEEAFLDAFFVNETTSAGNYAIGVTGWSRENVSFGEDGMRLGLERSDSPTEYWYGSEVSAKFETGYGYYEAEMMPYGAGTGVVTSFFIYNHANVDEIDVEFNSSKPNIVDLCYHAKGVSSGGPDSLAFEIDLGFDSSKEFHRYGFFYGPDMIVWYVDGEEIFRTYYTQTPDKVTSACSVIFSIWAGGERFENWLGESVEPVGADMAAYVRRVWHVPLSEMRAREE